MRSLFRHSARLRAVAMHVGAENGKNGRSVVGEIRLAVLGSDGDKHSPGFRSLPDLIWGDPHFELQPGLLDRGLCRDLPRRLGMDANVDA